MFHRHSVAGRVSIGISSGLVVGVLAIVSLPLFGFPLFSMFGFGTLLMFVFMGILIGFLGLFSRHPLLNFSMPWWVRGLMVGFMLTLMYILLSYGSLVVIMQSALVSWMGFSSPFWVLLDGMTLGVIISALETRFAGEGEELPLT
ncbi:hypothetical protein KJ819_00100 [Patescibacteria group bacterium]|nr:hypothetical protein [Patescibacteria group bacterium]MBU1500601.1 hypothetical protein [Patescibacteria group bacterium]MBU2080358.1 hypothetical protein [Patescibacteria group bacterium]MBU2124230.1 hypothetical protein [Patescibacteria group bacterium]MBU2194319.1 hypothetical protein [Patescibacteria group bacterium]